MFSEFDEERKAAIAEYRESAKSLIFDHFTEGVPTYGEKLENRLYSYVEKIRRHDVPVEPLDEEDYEIAYDALVLPFYVHYDECEYIEDLHENVWEEHYDTCDETRMREGMVNALLAFCTAGAALAKEIGAEKQRQLFRRALEEIETHCVERSDYSGGGMARKRAGVVLGWICDATRGLWAEVQIDNQLQKWKSEKAVPVAPEASGKGKAGNEPPKGDGANVETVALGAWAGKFITLDPTTRTLTLQARKNAKRNFTVPREYKNAWLILKWLLESQHPEGWHTIDEAHADLRDSWRQQFSHKSKPNRDMIDLALHIHSIKGPGERGSTTLRLEPKARKPPKRTSCKRRASKKNR